MTFTLKATTLRFSELNFSEKQYIILVTSSDLTFTIHLVTVLRVIL